MRLLPGRGYGVTESANGTTLHLVRSDIVGRPRFSGTAYVNGHKVTGLDSDPEKPWVKVSLADNTACEEDGPPPDPFPANEEWYLKNETYGDIHVVG